MNEAAGIALRRIVSNYGPAVCEDPRQVEALLRDMSGGEHRREVFVLVAAAREGVPGELLATGGSVPAAVLGERLALGLQDNLGLGEDAARWAVDTWAAALSVPGFGPYPDPGGHEVSQAGSQEAPGDRATEVGGAEMSWPDLRSTYMAILVEEGFRPEVDSEGDIHFKYEGGHYYVTDNCDESYFHLLYPGFWQLNSDAERTKAYLAANTATRVTKAAKVHVNSDGGNVSATLECLISSPADVRSFLGRGLRCIRVAVDSFRDEMRKG